MDFGFSEEQEMLRSSARDFLAKEAPMTYVRKMMDDERGYTDELWRKMAELGWMGLVLPEAHGGSGLDFVDMVVVLEEMLDDPQARHRRMVVEQADRRGETRRTLGNPLKLSATPPTLRTPPPDFGAHTDEILGALGYAAGDVAALRSRGIV